MADAIKPLYTAHGTAQGGRNGHTRSDDGIVDLDLSVPKEMGGPGKPNTGTPEHLFAAGYAACFIGAMKVAAGGLKLRVPPEAAVTATVGIGPRSEGGYGLDVELRVQLPGLDRADAERLVEAAHQICPYSNATRNNVDVRLSVA